MESNDQHVVSGGFQQGAGSAAANEDSKVQFQHPDRAAPPPPILTHPGSNLNATVSIGQSMNSEASRYLVESGRTSDDPTAEEKSQSGATSNRTVIITIPQQPDRTTDDENQETNSSFYWHSPQSSTDTTINRSPIAINDDGNRNLSAGNGIPSSTAFGSGLYSASALGFGGPSDWEHFEDYGGEEIDDTDLYIRPKANTGPSPDTVELPATKSPAEEPNIQQLNNAITYVHEESDKPTPLEEFREKQVPEESKFVHLSPLHQELTQHSEDDEHHQPTEELILTQDREVSSTPESSSTVPLSTPNYEESVQRSEDEDLQKRMESHDSKDDSQTEYTQLALPVDESANLLAPVLMIDERDGLSDVPEMEEEESDHEDTPDEKPVSSERQHEESVEPPRTHSDEHQESRNVIQDEAKSEDDAEVRLEEGTNSDHEPFANKPDLQRRHTNRLDDDGGEDIIISLQLPTVSHDDESESSHLFQTNENNAGGNLTSGSRRLEIPMQESVDQSRPKRLSVFPPSIEMADPYANLDPWAKASLNRYVKMLREEAQAERDEDKYRIFMSFTRRESRLRAILYDVDDEPDPVEHVVKRTPLKESTSILTLRPSIRSKALPALPPDAIGDNFPPLKTAPMMIPVHSTSKEKLRSEVEKKQSPPPGVSQQQSFGQQALADESYVMVDSPISEQHIPGGPILPEVAERDRKSPLKVTPSLTSLRNALENVAKQANAAFGEDSQSSNTHTETGMSKDKLQSDAQRSNSVPPVSSSGPGKDAVSDIDRPAYTPFRYNEGRPYEGDKATNRQSIYRPFSMSLRPGSIKSVETDNAEGPVSQQSSAGIKQDEDSVDTNDKPHQGLLQSEAKKNKSSKITIEIPAMQRNSILGPLFMVIPRTNILYPEPDPIKSLKHAIDIVPDEFSFIHKAVLAWDADAKHNRERHDRERNIRQGENEQRIDALFHDNEIGYGDISELEAEFKRGEAAKKADEDRAEFQSFVSQVFNTVWARLHFEMDQLMPTYQMCMQLVKDASAGRDMFENPDDRVPIALAMEKLLILYQKLAIRHQKAFEAVLERDRRLKTTEVYPWYALGNIQQVKKIKKRFEEAEKKAILDFCRSRDERANSLMDVLDHNTLRGVGTNQDYMESVMQAVRKIAMEVALGAVMEDQVVPTDEVLKAKTITTALARSSEQIVKTFHVADMLLNEANYEVSVANARIADADVQSFKQLRDSKEKEDQKLVKDLEHRLSLIRCDTSRTLDEIMKLLSLLRSNGGDSTPPRSTSAPADPEHEVRLSMALEEAKKRNAQKEAETNPIS